ncbi:MAG: hypothetical protein CMC33_04540 [Flavobacteriaceae bacterium]|nr:hypothetical protein [Flavobacteriaceae bacterium]
MMLNIFIWKKIIIMNDSSINNIKIDLARSKDSYIYDLNSKRKYLDFMGMYSTLCVGYNNEELINYYKELDVKESLVLNKITNCEINSDILQDFQEIFKSEMSLNKFSNYYFTSSGALAIEAAVKTAIKSSKKENPIILTFKGSFHGIYGYGGILTDRFDSVKSRLDGFPGNYWQRLRPFYGERSKSINIETIEESIQSVRNYIKIYENRIAGILVEPIQCTYGDHYLCIKYLKELKRISLDLNIPLIFDEIQTGFYSSGKKWYFDYTEVVPDILVFGKKAQLSGIMVSQKHSSIFKSPSTLEATWDSNLIDMFRSLSILKILKNKKNLSNQIIKNSNYFVSELKKHPELKNIRHCGYLIAMDFETKKNRNDFVQVIKKNGLLCNPTRSNMLRFRPHLLSSINDFDNALLIIDKSFKEMKKR